jgi:hypothetical protein
MCETPAAMPPPVASCRPPRWRPPGERGPRIARAGQASRSGGQTDQPFRTGIHVNLVAWEAGGGDVRQQMNKISPKYTNMAIIPRAIPLSFGEEGRTGVAPMSALRTVRAAARAPTARHSRIGRAGAAARKCPCPGPVRLAPASPCGIAQVVVLNGKLESGVHPLPLMISQHQPNRRHPTLLQKELESAFRASRNLECQRDLERDDRRWNHREV